MKKKNQYNSEGHSLESGIWTTGTQSGEKDKISFIQVDSVFTIIMETLVFFEKSCIFKNKILYLTKNYYEIVIVLPQQLQK